MKIGGLDNRLAVRSVRPASLASSIRRDGRSSAEGCAHVNHRSAEFAEPRHPGPIRTESRIDVPADGSQIARGTAIIAGVAWAQHRGIEAVEVRVDGQAWRPADTADALSIDTWRQWRLHWDATPGQHTIEVRAIDATGVPQTPQTADPFPAGATGYHTITVSVA